MIPMRGGGMGAGVEWARRISAHIRVSSENTDGYHRDANAAGELERAETFGSEILKLCVEVGGVLTGEHGVGVEKRDLMGVMFDDNDLNQQQRVKCAFDPDGLLNPGKVFPILHRCAELGRMHVKAGALPFPDLPRF